MPVVFVEFNYYATCKGMLIETATMIEDLLFGLIFTAAISGYAGLFMTVIGIKWCIDYLPYWVEKEWGDGRKRRDRRARQAGSSNQRFLQE